MLPAVIALVGVVIGGLLSGAVSYLSERTKTRAVLKAASRLLIADLLEISAIIGATVEQDVTKWGKLIPIELIHKAAADGDLLWSNNRDVFASCTSGEHWNSLMRMSRHLKDIEAKCEEFRVSATKLSDMLREIGKEPDQLREPGKRLGEDSAESRLGIFVAEVTKEPSEKMLEFRGLEVKGALLNINISLEAFDYGVKTLALYTGFRPEFVRPNDVTSAG